MVLTGYNTDIEYSGTVYHVQTEDKGQSNPLVESLVYTVMDAFRNEKILFRI